MQTKRQKIKRNEDIERNTAADMMPTDLLSQQILRERAELLAQHAPTKSDKIEIDYISFSLGNEECYGIPYEAIKEVIANVILTKLPYVPHYVAGILNRHGALLPVIDLRKFFNLKESKDNKMAYVLVVHNDDMTVGVLSNQIQGSDVYDSEILHAASPYEGSIKSEYILGLHKGNTAIINIKSILTDIQVELKSKLK